MATMSFVETTYLGFGSNVGNRELNLRKALALLAPEVVVRQTSPVYETVPMYAEDQPVFLNAVCEVETALSAESLLVKIKSIEKVMGEHVHNEPRVIDIDILFYGSLTAVFPGLTLPHPKVAERAFVIVPMADIAPRFVHPTLRCTIAELLQRLGDVSPLIQKTNITL